MNGFVHPALKMSRDFLQICLINKRKAAEAMKVARDELIASFSSLSAKAMRLLGRSGTTTYLCGRPARGPRSRDPTQSAQAPV